MRKLTEAQQALLSAVRAHFGQHRWSKVLKAACGWPRGGIGRSAKALEKAGYLSYPDGLHLTDKGLKALRHAEAQKERLPAPHVEEPTSEPLEGVPGDGDERHPTTEGDPG